MEKTHGTLATLLILAIVSQSGSIAAANEAASSPDVNPTLAALELNIAQERFQIKAVRQSIAQATAAEVEFNRSVSRNRTERNIALVGLGALVAASILLPRYRAFRALRSSTHPGARHYREWLKEMRLTATLIRLDAERTLAEQTLVDDMTVRPRVYWAELAGMSALGGAAVYFNSRGTTLELSPRQSRLLDATLKEKEADVEKLEFALQRLRQIHAKE